MMAEPDYIDTSDWTDDDFAETLGSLRTIDDPRLHACLAYLASHVGELPFIVHPGLAEFSKAQRRAWLLHIIDAHTKGFLG